MWKRLDLVGKRFGKLVVLNSEGLNATKNTLWRCKCDCGKEIVTTGTRLNRGKIRSCGCLIRPAQKRAVTKHGMNGTKLYFAWSSMKSRCDYKKNKSYKNYGGRGIRYCEEWKHFEPFYEWAKESGYEESLSLDRIDVNGNYEPSNCRWVTMKEQARNRRNNTLVTLNGETHTLIEWSEITKQRYYTLTCRIQRGWTKEEAVIGKRITARGES